MKRSDTYTALSLFHFAKELRKDVERLKRVVIFGNFGVYNIGDEAILAGQLHELSRLKGIKATVVSKNPKEIRRLHKTSSVSFTDPFAVLKTVHTSDAVIVGGGGILAKNDIGIISLFYQYYLWTIAVLIPLLYKKPVYVIGIGAYSNAHKLIVPYVVTLLRRARVVTVRDHHSLRFLKKSRVRSMLFKDNSFLMKPAGKVPNGMLSRDTSTKLRIGIALKAPGTRTEEKKILEALTLFILSYRKKADFWYFSFETNPRYMSDRSVGEKIRQLLSEKTNGSQHLFFVPTTWHPSVVLAAFKEMDYVISMRFHSSVFSYRQGVPFLGISYDAKCKSFLHAIGMKSYTPDKISLDLIKKSFVKRNTL